MFLGANIHHYVTDVTTGRAKNQYPYVGLYRSVTECPNEIILFGMTYYHHWFKEFVKSKDICVHFFLNEGSFLHLFDTSVTRAFGRDFTIAVEM